MEKVNNHAGAVSIGAIVIDVAFQKAISFACDFRILASITIKKPSDLLNLKAFHGN